MEPEIKRINFFDGLFLRQAEFQAEQLYHQHMRRRLNFMLFDGSGVVHVEPNDLAITPTAGKAFRITPGMAVSRRTDLLEGREIILREPSAPIDLATSGFVAGDQVFVTIHYEESTSDPQTVAAPNSPTRTLEVPVITVRNAAAGIPAPGSAPGGENPILLGRIAFDTMTVDTSQRQAARIRASLLGAAPLPPSGAPTITTITPNSAAPGSAVAVQIIGTNLAGATVACSDPAVTVSGTVATATTINFTLTIGAAAANFTLTVTTATAPAATAAFTVTALPPGPVINLLSPNQQISGAAVDIRGTTLRNPALLPGAQATGTSVRIVGPGATKVVPPANITVRPNVGANQVVRIVVPDRTGTVWGTKENVTLELTFGAAAPASTAFQYDD